MRGMLTTTRGKSGRRYKSPKPREVYLVSNSNGPLEIYAGTGNYYECLLHRIEFAEYEFSKDGIQISGYEDKRGDGVSLQFNIWWFRPTMEAKQETRRKD